MLGVEALLNYFSFLALRGSEPDALLSLSQIRNSSTITFGEVVGQGKTYESGVMP
jgi:hypothetical protein